jgi:alkanesulfonate monooxygenase
LELCRCAEAIGIDSVLMPVGLNHPDPTLLAAALGRHTERLKFMIACCPGLISPTIFVQQINTLSMLIGGRVHINIVCGHTPRELGDSGGRLSRDEWNARLDEFLAVCRAFWDRGEGEVNFEGKYFQIGAGRILTPFKTSGPNRPEIYFDGDQEDSAGTASRHADCVWRFAEPVESLQRTIGPLLATGAEVGIVVSLLARKTRREAVYEAYELKRRLHDVVRGAELSSEPHANQSAFRATCQLAHDWAAPSLWTGAVRYLGAHGIALVGSPDDITQALMEYWSVGVTQVLFMGWPDAEQITLFGRDIEPRIRSWERGVTLEETEY